TEPGAGIRLKLSSHVDYAANHNTFQYNRLTNIGHNGFDIFGPHNLLAYNVIQHGCISKGDCGAIRTFGRTNLASTELTDVDIHHNIIIDIVGNTDGTHPTYRALYGNGLYIDHFSKNITATHNTVISTTIDGILVQNSAAQLLNNTVYNGSSGTLKRGQISLYQGETEVTMQGNRLYALKENARTLYAWDNESVSTADYNYFYHPYRQEHMYMDRIFTEYDLAAWQNYAGTDSHSQEHWLQLDSNDPPRSLIFYNDSKNTQLYNLGNNAYLDLDQQAVTCSLTLAPFTSQILIRNGDITAPCAELTEHIYLPLLQQGWLLLIQFNERLEMASDNL
ncbi:MAG: hypothetical protein KAG66_22725, partial [Methylococcales bacterium]|nr:hypothetical protein [Methylococcales bacterium]